MFILIQIFLISKLCLWDYTDQYYFKNMVYILLKYKSEDIWCFFSYLKVEKAASNPDDEKNAQATNLTSYFWITSCDL